ncbi:MAG: hypothetical protein AAF160_08640 [Pseudomonadota bacterium]
MMMLRSFGVVALVTFGLGHAPAGAVTFSDLSDFLAVTDTSLETFDGTAPQQDPSIDFGPFTITETFNGPGEDITVFQQGFNGGLVDFAINSEDEAVAYLDNGTSVVTFDDFDPSITAFGVFFSASAASTVTVTGTVSTSFAVIANTPTFFGVTEASGITSLSFDVSGGPFVGIDDVRTGSIDTAAIPLPGALGLLLLGLGAFGVLRRAS